MTDRLGCEPSGTGKLVRRTRSRAVSARGLRVGGVDGLARQRYALIDSETDQRQQREQDRDHQGADRAAIIMRAVAPRVVETCARGHPNLLGFFYARTDLTFGTAPRIPRAYRMSGIHYANGSRRHSLAYSCS